MAVSSFDIEAIRARLAPLRDAPHVPSPGPHAAVAAILRPGSPGGGAEVLLIRRAERPGDPWSGHMAFPGGRRDAADADLLATAVRETREEVGIDLDARGSLLGRLADLEAIARARPTGLTITPFVFALDAGVEMGGPERSPQTPPITKAPAPLVFDPREVAEALWVPLAPLARGEGAGTIKYERDGHAIELPSWTVEGRVVWGLTHRMLQTLFEVLSG